MVVLRAGDGDGGGPAESRAQGSGCTSTGRDAWAAPRRDAHLPVSAASVRRPAQRRPPTSTYDPPRNGTASPSAPHCHEVIVGYRH